MNFYDKDAYAHEADKRIHALKREIKELSKYRRAKKMQHKIGDNLYDLSHSIKDGSKHLFNKLKGKSDIADYLDRRPIRHPSKLAALALGIGAVLTTVRAIKHHRCHYH